MGDQHKSGDELLREVRALRARVAALERPTAGTAGGEEALRAVLDHICGFVGVLTPDGCLADVNRSALEAGGFSREQVLGRPFWETGWWDRSPAVQAQLREDVAEAARGRRVRRESTYFTAAGDERVADRTLTPVTDGAGGVVMIVADGLDVTDRRRAEEEVKRAEARFRALVEYQFDGVALSAADGTVLYVSPSARRSAGFADDEVVGHSPFEFIHPDDHDRAARALADALARPREPVTTEYRVRGRDGSWRWVEVVARNLQDEPAVRAVVSNYRDVTERRHAEDALRRAREGLQDQVRSRTAEVEAERARLAEVFRLAPSFMAVLRGPDHVLERANDRFAEFTGGRVPLGRPVRETFPEIEGQGYFEILDRVYRTGEPFVSGDARMMLDRGTGLLDERKFEFVYQPMRDAAGAVAGILLQGVDLTPRIRAEQALRESEDRFARFMRHLPGAAWMKDLEGRYVYASEAVGRLVGVETAELLGKRDEEFLPPHTAAQFREHDARARAVDSGVRVVETAADPTGVVRHYLVSKFPIRGPGGELSLVGGMAFEITDRIRAEEALRASEERFAQFMRHLPGVAWIKDLEGRHVFANAAFEREFGLAPGGAAGRTNAELFARGVAARYDETDRLALGGGYTAVESDPGVRSWARISSSTWGSGWDLGFRCCGDARRHGGRADSPQVPIPGGGVG